MPQPLLQDGKRERQKSNEQNRNFRKKATC